MSINPIDKKLLDYNTKEFKRAISFASKKFNRFPTIRFLATYCPHRTGCVIDEVAHIHLDTAENPDGIICVSNYRLRSMNTEQVIDTALHEFTHIFFSTHDSEFKKLLNDTKKDFHISTFGPGHLKEETTPLVCNDPYTGITQTEKEFIKIYDAVRTTYATRKNFKQVIKLLEQARWKFPNVENEEEDLKGMQSALLNILYIYNDFVNQGISSIDYSNFKEDVLTPLYKFLLKHKKFFKEGYLQEHLKKVEIDKEQTKEKLVDPLHSNEVSTKSIKLNKKTQTFVVIEIDDVQEQHKFEIKRIEKNEIYSIGKFETNQYGRATLNLVPGKYRIEIPNENVTMNRNIFYVDENDPDPKAIIYANTITINIRTQNKMFSPTVNKPKTPTGFFNTLKSIIFHK